MGRRKSKKSRKKTPIGQVQRVNHYFAKSPTLLKRHRFYDKPFESIQKVGDNRYWRPRQNDLLKIDGTETKIIATKKSRTVRKSTQKVSPLLSFQDPRRTVVCRKRRQRRISLFARNKIGSGRRVTRRRKMKSSSKIRC